MTVRPSSSRMVPLGFGLAAVVSIAILASIGSGAAAAESGLQTPAQLSWEHPNVADHHAVTGDAVAVTDDGDTGTDDGRDSDGPRDPADGHESGAGRAPDGSDGETSLNVSVGAQLSTVIETNARDVHADVKDTGFAVEFETGDRAAAVADRLADLETRASEVRESYEAATAAYENGDISGEEYARRLASLHGDAERLRGSLRRLATHAALLGATAREEIGLDKSRVQGIADDLSAVEGAGHRALLARFTGHGQGNVEVSLDPGFTIEVWNDDGHGFRTVRRSNDDSTDVSVDRSRARETARDALSSAWNWQIASEEVDYQDGEHRFEFTLDATDERGGADVHVDASSGAVVHLDEGIVKADGWWGTTRDWQSGIGAPSNSPPGRQVVPEDSSGLFDGDDGDWLDRNWTEGSGDSGENNAEGWWNVSDGHQRNWTDLETDGDVSAGNDTRSDIPDDTDTRGDVSAGNDTRSDVSAGNDTRSDVPDGNDTRSDTPDGNDTRSDTPDGDDTRSDIPDGDGDQRGTPDGDGDQRDTPDGDGDQRGTPDGDGDQRDTPEDDSDQRDATDDDGGENADAGDGEDRDADAGTGDETEAPWTNRTLNADEGVDVTVTEGTAAPGRNIRLAVEVDGSPAADATVSINGGFAGQTDETGTAPVALPHAEEVEFHVEAGDAEALLVYEFRDDG